MTRPLPVRARGEGPAPRLHTTKTQRCDAGNRLKNLAQLQSTNRSSNQIGKQYSSGRNIRKSPAHLTHGLKVHAHSVSGRARLRGVWRAGRATRFYRRYFLNDHVLLVVGHESGLHKKRGVILWLLAEQLCYSCRLCFSAVLQRHFLNIFSSLSHK